MTSRARDEDRRPGGPREAGSFDALTFSFGDAEARVFGLARLELADGRAAGLALVIRDGASLVRRVDGDASSSELTRAGGLTAELTESSSTWRVALAEAPDGSSPAFDLAFEATSPPMPVAGDAAGATGGERCEQACRVSGTVADAPFTGLGQRGRSWGAPAWDRLASTREVSAWLDEDHAVALFAARRTRSRGHAEETMAAFVVDGDREEPLARVAEPLMSTTYDGEGRPRRVGVELHVGEGDHPRHAAGEVVAAATLDVGERRLECAFLRWHMEGRVGIGSYAVLRRR